MNFSKYTTKELEFITSNIELLKKELKKRHIKELDDFPFKVGDVIHTKDRNSNYFIKIKKVYEKDKQVYIDEIIISEDGTFDSDVNECYAIDNIEWFRYTKVEDSDLSDTLIKIIDKYNNDLQQLYDDTYLKLKNEIAPYDYNV